MRAREPAGDQRAVDVDHRALEDVGGAALDREVDGVPLGAGPDLTVAAGQVRAPAGAVRTSS